MLRKKALLMSKARGERTTTTEKVKATKYGRISFFMCTLMFT